MNFFDHPFWALLVFGFFVTPRILLFSLWLPIKAPLGEVISHPILSYLGIVFAPRFTLACLLGGFYGKDNMGLTIAAFLIAVFGEGTEKYFLRRGSQRSYSGFRSFFKFPRIHIHLGEKRNPRDNY